MSKSPPHPDVLVLGQHPSAYLAAIALRTASSGKLRVLHSTIPGDDSPDRLITLNPDFFNLHKSLAPLAKSLDLCPIFGLRFLSPSDPRTASEHRDKSPLAYIATYNDVRQALADLAKESGVELHQPKSLDILPPDETGVDISLGKTTLRAKSLLLAGTLPPQLQTRLALPEAWGHDIVHRYSFLRLEGKNWSPLDPAPLQAMALDLNNSLFWGWHLCKPEECQLAVEQPLESLSSITPQQLLSQWAAVLHQHGHLKDLPNITPRSIESIDLPLAGALAHEGVANRTLLIGPAGGFYSATGEDIYPNCWSAIYAADVLRKALKEPHLQDALNNFRHIWRTTLGEYLRGPQQNLRFLLPLIYRNPVMTARLAESILQGKSIVR